MRKGGVSDEEIAARLDLKVDAVCEAIQRFESIRASVNNEIVDMAVNVEALVALEGVGDDLREARNGLRFTGAYDQEGSPIFERDYSLMLESISGLGALVEKTRPKGGGVQINTAIQNNGGGNGNGNGGQGRSFEAMLREAKAQRALTEGDGGGAAVAVAEADPDIQDAEFDEDEDDADNGYDDADDAGIDEEMDNGE